MHFGSTSPPLPQLTSQPGTHLALPCATLPQCGQTGTIGPPGLEADWTSLAADVNVDSLLFFCNEEAPLAQHAPVARLTPREFFLTPDKVGPTVLL